MIFASKLFPNPFTNNNCRYQSQILCVTVYTKINIYIFCLTIDHLFKLIFVTCSFKHLKNIKSYFHSIQFFTTATMHLFFFSLSQIYKIGLHCAGNMALYNKLPTIFSRSGFPYHNLIIPPRPLPPSKGHPLSATWGHTRQLFWLIPGEHPPTSRICLVIQMRHYWLKYYLF